MSDFNYRTGEVVKKRKPEDRQSRHETPLRLYRSHGTRLTDIEKRVAILEKRCLPRMTAKAKRG